MATADFVTTTATELADRIDRAHERFVQVLTGAPPDREVGDTWRATDVAAHLVNVVNRYNAFDPARLADTPRGVDEINQREAASLADLPMPALLDALDRELQQFHERWGPQHDLPLDLPLPFHGGATIDLQSGLTNLIGELLVHGLDVAAAGPPPHPSLVEPRDGELLCGFGTQILPFYVRRTNTDRVLFRLDADGVTPWLLDVDGPAATSRPPTAHDEPDVHLAGPPATVALLFYGRLTPAAAEAAGLRIVGGTHPDRAASLPDLLEQP